MRSTLMTLLLCLCIAVPAIAAQQTLDTNEVGSYTGDGGTSNNAKANANFTELYGSEVKLATLTIADGDFAAGAGAQTLDIVTPSATSSAIIIDVWADLTEVFAGGALSACTLQIGQDEGPNTDAYVAAFDVFTGATLAKVGLKSAEWGVDLVLATRQPILAATQKVTATFTPTSDDMENATSGSVTVYVLYRLLG